MFFFVSLCLRERKLYFSSFKQQYIITVSFHTNRYRNGARGTAVIIALACDHAGFALKGEVRKVIEELGHKVLDLGTFSEDPVDYPDYAYAVEVPEDVPPTRPRKNKLL